MDVQAIGLGADRGTSFVTPSTSAVKLHKVSRSGRTWQQRNWLTYYKFWVTDDGSFRMVSRGVSTLGPNPVNKSFAAS